MNFTILSLVTAQSFSISPLIAGRNNMRSISSTFSRSFSPIFFTQNLREYNLNYNHFSFILSSAVVLSSEDQENKKISKRFADNGELSKVKITYCLFLKCTSKENGGGIFIGSSSSITTFTLKSTGFFQCQSKKGDAFYSQTGSMSCQNCCINKCSNSAFYVNEKQSFDFQYNCITNSKLNSDIEQTPEFNNFDFVNLSYNTDAIKISSESDSEIVLASCEFNSNAGDSLFIVSSQNINTFSIQNSNFNNNDFINTIVNIKSKTYYNSLSLCFFNEDNSKYYFQCSSTLRINKCVFSGTESKEKEKFPQTAKLSECTFVKILTTNIAFPATNECWNKMPKTLPPIHLDANTILTVGAVIVLAVGFIFILCKLRNRNKYSNQMTMYTK